MIRSCKRRDPKLSQRSGSIDSKSKFKFRAWGILAMAVMLACVVLVAISSHRSGAANAHSGSTAVYATIAQPDGGKFVSGSGATLVRPRMTWPEQAWFSLKNRLGLGLRLQLQVTPPTIIPEDDQ